MRVNTQAYSYRSRAISHSHTMRSSKLNLTQLGEVREYLTVGEPTLSVSTSAGTIAGYTLSPRLQSTVEAQFGGENKLELGKIMLAIVELQINETNGKHVPLSRLREFLQDESSPELNRLLQLLEKKGWILIPRTGGETIITTAGFFRDITGKEPN